jgi:XTP/dITP diphosphohydrolase
MQKIVLATGNLNKLKEIRELFRESNFEILSLYDFNDLPEIIEDGKTFKENSLIKVKTVFNSINLPIIGDDSGLEVKQLGNRPGIYSARYAGENCTYADNNKKLLQELKNFDPPHFARFVCAASYYDGKNIITVEGELKGKIIENYRGENGFGYDPSFLPEGFNKTLSEMTLDEKNKISHRAKAFLKLKEMISTFALNY